jgi:hypothetical protein
MKIAALLGLTFILQTSSLEAAIFFQIRPAPDGAVELFIEASGFVSATNDSGLVVGTLNDTFLPNGAPQRYSGLVPAAPTPMLLLGGMASVANFYRDDGAGTYNGLSSILGLSFGTFTLNGVLDLSDLNGTYYLPESRFSDFVPGSYSGLWSSIAPVALQGLGEVTLQVIPEPSSSGLLLGFGSLGLMAARRRRGCDRR